VTVLQARSFRSVRLEPRDGSTVVVKRFHHPGPLGARLDRLRARRELAALAELERAGLPVPHPLALRRTEGGLELHLAAVPGARSLREWLAGDELPPGGWSRLLARLGALLARLQAAGWRHGDLHPGNALVDEAGAPWLVDLQRAARAAPDAARCLDEVVECAAAAREALPAAQRARFLAAWLATLPAELRPRLGGAELLRAIEERARERRIARVRGGLARWLRPSSRVRVLLHEGVPALVRRDLPAAMLARPPDERWLVLRGPREELRSRWLGAARMHEHGLRAASPGVLLPAARWPAGTTVAAFELPPPEEGSRAKLEARLAERGLALTGAALACAGRGGHWLPPREPEDFVELAAGQSSPVRA
jgi:tRNA A-37 threonylcarbamoyl transferase component Bud32